jgi:hypothetical protein
VVSGWWLVVVGGQRFSEFSELSELSELSEPFPSANIAIIPIYPCTKAKKSLLRTTGRYSYFAMTVFYNIFSPLRFAISEVAKRGAK